MDLGLKGKCALVAGASRGLGFATARGLALEGARVIINSRDPQGIEQAAQKISMETNAEIYPVAADITDTQAAGLLIHKTIEKLGNLDMLVTNAGGPPPGKFETFEDQTWYQAIELSLMSHVRLIRNALPYLRQSRIASVLAITSYSVKQPIPNLILSNSIRAATIGLIKTLALELGSDGIRFNSILPAWMETERVYQLMSARAQANGTTVEQEIQFQAQDSPLGRMGHPDEFANAAVFLLSPAASYITGVMLSVDGGMYKGVF